MTKTALFSLNVLDKAAEFARSLSECGWTIIASQESCDVLSKEGIPSVNIADFTGVKENYGFPPTLHPKIEACLTLDGDERIDLVYVIPYPLSAGNDVGGRTLLALAAKGKRIPVMSVADMEQAVAEIENRGDVSAQLRQALIDKTNALSAFHYDELIQRRDRYDILAGSFHSGLMNGENPYQVPADFFSLKGDDPLALHLFHQVKGEKPCYTNMADADAILQTMCCAAEAFDGKYRKVPHICVAAKHGNACGMGISWSDPAQAVEKALFGNPLAVWGGEVISNFTIDEPLAQLLFKSAHREKLFGDAAWMLDVVLAPEFSGEAAGLLGRRSQRKLFTNPALRSARLSTSAFSYRFVRGGFLRQPPHSYVLDFSAAEWAGNEELSGDLCDSLIVAWAVAWSTNHGGNEIALAKDGALLGTGGGPSTVEAAQIALMRAHAHGHSPAGAVFAADAFFPFTDTPAILCENKVRAGLVPKGGKAFDAVKSFFASGNVSVVYLPEKFRGFCRH